MKAATSTTASDITTAADERPPSDAARRTALRAGDLVVVRSREEILATLGDDGMLDRMPFMPEMLQHCGRTFRVAAVAHKTCDPAHKTGGRRLADAVDLEDIRCDGSHHGGCQAACLIFWKTAWLAKSAASAGHSGPTISTSAASTSGPGPRASGPRTTSP